MIEELPDGPEVDDPFDAFLLAIVDAGDADWLVTGDHRAGLLALGAYSKARISTPSGFVAASGICTVSPKFFDRLDAGGSTRSGARRPSDSSRTAPGTGSHASLAEVDLAAVATVSLAERRAQPVGGFGDEDEVDVIVHQAPAEAGDVRRLAAIGDEGEIGAAIVVGEEHREAAIAALRHMMRDAGDDDAGETGHARGVAGEGMGVNLV